MLVTLCAAVPIGAELLPEVTTVLIVLGAAGDVAVTVNGSNSDSTSGAAAVAMRGAFELVAAVGVREPAADGDIGRQVKLLVVVKLLLGVETVMLMHLGEGLTPGLRTPTDVTRGGGAAPLSLFSFTLVVPSLPKLGDPNWKSLVIVLLGLRPKVFATVMLSVLGAKLRGGVRAVDIVGILALE